MNRTVDKTMLVEKPKFAEHYRDTHLKGGDPEVFVRISQPWQEAHEHYFEELTRFGSGICFGCGVEAWSMWWVADELYGDGTQDWCLEMERTHRDMLATAPGTITVIAAALDPSQPAKTMLSGRPGRHRAHGRKGIDVPTMPFGLLG